MEKEQLIQNFIDFVKEDRLLDDTDEKKIDLYNLFSELSSLKAEVKLESRQFKKSITETQRCLNILEDNNKQLLTEVNHLKKINHLIQESTEKPFILIILDFLNRINNNLSIIDSYNKKKSWFKDNFTDTIYDSLKIFQSKIIQTLEENNVFKIETNKEIFDPKKMKVISTINDPLIEDNIVVEEVKPGYYWKDSILQLSHVIINKL